MEAKLEAKLEAKRHVRMLGGRRLCDADPGATHRWSQSRDLSMLKARLLNEDDALSMEVCETCMEVLRGDREAPAGICFG